MFVKFLLLILVEANHFRYSTRKHREAYNKKRKAHVLELGGVGVEDVPYHKHQCSMEDSDIIDVEAGDNRKKDA